ncbi:hypothetical protein MRX96_006585 [Rhipicephalus microplus]
MPASSEFSQRHAEQATCAVLWRGLCPVLLIGYQGTFAAEHSGTPYVSLSDGLDGSPDHEAQLNAIQRLDVALARQKRTEETPSSSRWACRR